MTERSGACDVSDFDCDTNFVGSDDSCKNEHVFISRFESTNISTGDKMIDFISFWVIM